MDDPPRIEWRLYLKAPRERVFDLLSTDPGRGSFWARSTVQEGDEILFLFPNGEELRSRVVQSTPPEFGECLAKNFAGHLTWTVELRDRFPRCCARGTPP